MSTPSTRVRGLLGAAACLAVLAACGEDTGTGSDPSAEDATASAGSPSDSPTASSETSATPGPTGSSAAGGPTCEEVWVDGATLPEGYRGCSRDGAWQEAERTPCSFGVPIVTFDGRYYAVPGKVVNDVGDLDSSKDYQRAVNSCQG